MIPHVDPLSVNVFIWVLRMLLGRVSYFSDFKIKPLCIIYSKCKRTVLNL